MIGVHEVFMQVNAKSKKIPVSRNITPQQHSVMLLTIYLGLPIHLANRTFISNMDFLLLKPGDTVTAIDFYLPELNMTRTYFINELYLSPVTRKVTSEIKAFVGVASESLGAGVITWSYRCV